MWGTLKIFYNAHGMLHLCLVVEVHLQMHAIASDIVEQGFQFVQCHPACHDALACLENLAIQVVPLGRATLRFSHTGCPLHGIEFLYLEQGRQVVHCAHAIQMIQGIVNLLALLTDEGLHKAAVILYTDHGGYIALQLGHLAWCP